MVKLRFHRQEFQFPYSFSASLVRHLNIFTLGKRDINNAQMKKKKNEKASKTFNIGSKSGSKSIRSLVTPTLY